MREKLGRRLRKLRRWLHPKIQRLRNLLYTATYSLGARVRPMRPGSVILVTNRSSVLTDNLLFIDRALDRDKHAVSHFFFAQRPRTALGRLRPSLRFIWAMSQTEYTIVDDFLPLVYPARLRPGARLVQVWHALGALKRVGYSRGGHDGGPPSTSISHKNYTDVIVSADAVRPNFAEAFGVPLSVVHATGVPRTDLFFDPAAQAAVKEELHRRLPFLRGRRVILFAPTFRGQDKKSACYPADFLDLEEVGAALGEDDLLILKMHPFVRQPPVIPPAYQDRIVDLSDFPEFNHLLLVTDLLVTDYSSAIFDYALLGRPIVFYTPDLEDYLATRGLYYDFDDYTYGPVVRDTPALIDALGRARVDETRLRAFCERFLNRCDGRATARFVETVFGEPVAAAQGDQPQM